MTIFVSTVNDCDICKVVVSVADAYLEDNATAVKPSLLQNDCRIVLVACSYCGHFLFAI